MTAWSADMPGRRHALSQEAAILPQAVGTTRRACFRFRMAFRERLTLRRLLTGTIRELQCNESGAVRITMDTARIAAPTRPRAALFAVKRARADASCNAVTPCIGASAVVSNSWRPSRAQRSFAAYYDQSYAVPLERYAAAGKRNAASIAELERWCPGRGRLLEARRFVRPLAGAGARRGWDPVGVEFSPDRFRACAHASWPHRVQLRPRRRAALRR